MTPDELDKIAQRFRPYFRFTKGEEYLPCKWEWYYKYSEIYEGAWEKQLVPNPNSAGDHPGHAETHWVNVYVLKKVGESTNALQLSDIRKYDIYDNDDADHKNSNIFKKIIQMVNFNDVHGSTWEDASSGNGFYCHASEISQHHINLEYWVLFGYNKVDFWPSQIPGTDHYGDLICVQMLYNKFLDRIVRVSYVLHGKTLLAYDIPEVNLFPNTPEEQVGIPIPNTACYSESNADSSHVLSFYRPDKSLYFMADNVTNRFEHLAVFVERNTHEPWPNPSGSYTGVPEHSGDGNAFLPQTVTLLDLEQEKDAPFIFFGGSFGDPNAMMRHRIWYPCKNSVLVPEDFRTDSNPYTIPDLHFPTGNLIPNPYFNAATGLWQHAGTVPCQLHFNPEFKDSNFPYARLTADHAAGGVWMTCSAFNVSPGHYLFVDAHICSNMALVGINVHEYDETLSNQISVTEGPKYTPNAGEYSNHSSHCDKPWYVQLNSNTKRVIICIVGIISDAAIPAGSCEVFPPTLEARMAAAWMYAPQQVLPHVVQLPRANNLPIPTGLKQSCVQGPDTLSPSPTHPVVNYFGINYWAYGYQDDRNGMAIVAYDFLGNFLRQWNRQGAHYVYKITIEEPAQTVTFWGQNNNRIILSWTELSLDSDQTSETPKIASVSLTGITPNTPTGLVHSCWLGPDNQSVGSQTPVILWLGYTYWVYSYRDNREGMAIVAYDSSGTFINRADKIGARYAYKITVDDAAQTVTFWGQEDDKIIMTWAELSELQQPAKPPEPQIPVVELIPQTGIPIVPPGLFAYCYTGADPSYKLPYPIIRFLQHTYWAYSYLDARSSMAIFVYNSAGQVINSIEKTGARNVYKITIEAAAQTATFWGQNDDKIIMTWAELSELQKPILPSEQQTPIIVEIPNAYIPPVPTDLRATCKIGPDSFENSPNFPVISFLGLNYWAFSYQDNRGEMAILAYDASKNIVKRWNKTGARYLYKITIEETARAITFWGQGNDKIVMPWDELKI